MRAIPFSRKFLICFTAALVCSNTEFRIVNRLAWERGAGPAVPIALAVIILLTGLIYPFIWQKSQSSPDQSRLSFWRNLLCYGIAIDLAMFGIQKLSGLQAHVHIALLDGPLSSFSGEDLSWAYYGRSPVFFNVIGLLQIAGSLFLVFPRTKLLGVFTLLPVMVNISLMGFFYHFYPGEQWHAIVLVLGLLYILLEDHDLVLFFFFRSGPLEPATRQPAAFTAPASLQPSAQQAAPSQPASHQPAALAASAPSQPAPATPAQLQRIPASAGRPLLTNAIRLSVVFIPLLLILGFFHLPDNEPVHGKYKVTGLWMNNKTVDPHDCADSVLTVVYLDEGKDCVFEYNSQQRRVIGDYTIDKQAQRLNIIWHYPATVHDTLVARFLPDGSGAVHLDGSMGHDAVRMDWQKVW